MALGGKACICVWRTVARLVLAVLLVSTSLLAGSRPASAADVAELIKKLDRTEWEIVRDEVTARLPDLIATKEEQDSFREMLKHSQTIANMAEAYQSEDYETLQKISAESLGDNLEAAIAARFGEESSLYKSAQLLKDERNRELAKALTAAALNLDSEKAGTAIKNYLTEHAKERFDKLQAEGETLLKDTLRSIIPGGEKLASYGFDPIEIYIQQVKDFRDFTAATRLRFNDAVLNCQAELYLKVRDESDAETALQRLRIYDSPQGKSDLKCASTPGPTTTLGRWVEAITKLGSGAGGRADYDLTHDDVAALADEYDKLSDVKKRNTEFAEWVREQLLTTVKERARSFREGIDAEQERVAEERRTEMDNVMAAIETEIGELDRGKPDEPKDKTPRDKDTPVAGTQDKDEDEDTSQRAADGSGGKEEPEKVTVQCDKLTALTASARRASASEAGKLVSDLSAAETAAREEGNCGADVFADADSARDRLQRISALSDRLQAAIRNCDVDALPALKSEAASLGSSTFDNEITLLQTASTGISQFNKGKATFDGGKYAEAKAPLDRAKSAFEELPSGACQTYADRTHDGLDQVAKVVAQQAIVNRALNTCDVEDMKAILSEYKGRKFRFFTESVARIKAALPKCEEKERIIAEGKFCDKARGRVEAATAHFQASKFKTASKELTALDKALNETNTKRCSDLPGRVRQVLSKITAMKKDNSRLQQAAKACEVGTLKTLATRFKHEDHRWYKEASAQAIGRIEDCEGSRQLTEEEAIAACRREVKAKGKVYAATDYESDGSYKCHWCEPGQVANGSACVWDTAAAEADCRRQAAAKGKVYAKTEVRNDGRYDCFWCNRGEIYANGQCGTVAAHSEAECRQLAARKGKVYAKTIIHKNGKYDCLWCEPGQIYANGQCGTVAAHNEAACRRIAASKGKVYAKTILHKNGTYDCLWCEPGQYYANGRCYYPQQAQPRAQQPRGAIRAPSAVPCNPTMENYGKCWGNPQPQKLYPCMHRKGMGPFGC